MCGACASFWSCHLCQLCGKGSTRVPIQQPLPSPITFEAKPLTHPSLTAQTYHWIVHYEKEEVCSKVAHGKAEGRGGHGIRPQDHWRVILRDIMVSERTLQTRIKPHRQTVAFDQAFTPRSRSAHTDLEIGKDVGEEEEVACRACDDGRVQGGRESAFLDKREACSRVVHYRGQRNGHTHAVRMPRPRSVPERSLHHALPQSNFPTRLESPN